MSGNTTKRMHSFATLLIGAVIFIAINIIANNLLDRYRIDLTYHHLYTLSEGTEHVVTAIEEPVKLRFFFSDATANGFPQIQAYGNRVKGILKEYVKQSGGKLQLEIINPEPFTEEEDLAVKLGVQSIPLDETGTKLYFGLIATNSVDEIGSIPFFDPSRASWLEYDITRIIYDLSLVKKPVIGIMTWLPLYGGGSGPDNIQGKWAILDQINKNFASTYVDRTAKEIPKEVDVLMVVHPVGITEDTLYAIDQFLMRGGRALFFTDPYINIKGLERTDSNLNKLYNTWGFDMPSTDLVLDKSIAIRMADSERGSALRTVSNPAWLALAGDNFNKDDLVSSTLQLMRLVAAGRLVTVEEAAKHPTPGNNVTFPKVEKPLTMEPLIFTGTEAMVGKSFELMFDKDPSAFLKNYKVGGKKLVLAARFTGKATSAFPQRKDKGHLAESKKDINVIAITDADMLQDGFWIDAKAFYGNKLVVPTAHNGAFVLNALDLLSGSEDLISLRSRSDYDRPFKKVEAIRQDAEVRFRNREQDLRAKLSELEQKITAMRSTNRHEGNELLLSSADEQELLSFRDEILATRKELRKVQHSLIEDIDSLGYQLKAINIGAVALLVILLAFFLPRRLGVKRS